MAGTAVIIAGCSSSKPKPSTKHLSETSTSSSVNAGGQVVGVIGIGHSGLTGALTDPAAQGDARQNSWVTGTNPAVDSIYERLVRVEPAAKGHVSNEGIDGSKADSLVEELQSGFQVVPHPQLVIIQTIDNDVMCDGTDAANQPVFGAEVRQALNLIVRTSPRTKVLAISQFGRPAEFFHTINGIPNAVNSFEGTGICDAYNPHGKYVPAHVATLLKIIQMYERTLATVCHQFPQCTYTDVGTHYLDKPANLVAGDWNHPSVPGHAAFAALIWPVVAKLLGVPLS